MEQDQGQYTSRPASPLVPVKMLLTMEGFLVAER